MCARQVQTGQNHIRVSTSSTVSKLPKGSDPPGIEDIAQTQTGTGYQRGDNGDNRKLNRGLKRAL